MFLKKLTIPLACLLIIGCENTSLYQKITFLPEQAWSNNNQPHFTFNISDTSARYRVFFIVRHTDAYEYTNIWIQATTHLPGEDSSRSGRFNIPLANEKKWLGTGMDDIYDHRVLLYPQPVQFKKTGTYSIEFKQDMRIDPLPNVINVGLRLEKLN